MIRRRGIPTISLIFPQPLFQFKKMAASVTPVAINQAFALLPPPPITNSLDRLSRFPESDDAEKNIHFQAVHATRMNGITKSVCVREGGCVS
jgi:hypothetical protein